MQKLFDAGASSRQYQHARAGLRHLRLQRGFFTAQPIGTRNAYDRTRTAAAAPAAPAPPSARGSPRRARQRHRRIGAHPGGVDGGACGRRSCATARRAHAHFALARHGGADGADGGRRRAARLRDHGPPPAGAGLLERREARRLSRVLLQGPGRRHDGGDGCRAGEAEAGGGHDRRGRHARAAEAQRRGELPVAPHRPTTT